MQNGADIIIADMKEPAAEFAALCESEGRKYFFVEVNLLDEQSSVGMVAAAREKTGWIDILVNAAGVNKLLKAEEYDSKAWDFVLGINLRGLYLVTREFGKIMIEQNYGRILSISSVKSFIGTDQDYTAYCASKGAVNMYTKQLACEWGNTVSPSTRSPRRSPERRSTPSSWTTPFSTNFWSTVSPEGASARRAISAARRCSFAATRRSLSAVRSSAWTAV